MNSSPPLYKRIQALFEIMATNDHISEYIDIQIMGAQASGKEKSIVRQGLELGYH
ncbi:hypothetical protein GCM10022218_38610 [Sphingobacterium ginsenosidimutans]|uniref:Uncharacterized protein n=1 Tax=Sphingobacterium ginsenosidimutans TaxID=687845 RepID=A0ABP8ADK3_9SPHI